MPRYFLEVTYKGARYSGFQVQQNANTVQAEAERALEILLREKIILTGSSRTDTGVHALQNYFHFDRDEPVHDWQGIGSVQKFQYKINAILPEDIVVKNLIAVKEDAHCRFDAIAREYRYYIYREKNPFLQDRAYYFPYRLDLDLLQQSAGLLKGYEDFSSFSRRNTQVKSFNCVIGESEWMREGDCLVYRVKGNRFLRGMVRALTATMLRVGRGKLVLEDFREIIESKDSSAASFAVPGKGLFLVSVEYPEGYFDLR